MKHAKLLSLSLIAIGLGVSSCSNDNDPSESAGRAIRFTVVAPPTPRNVPKVETTTTTINNFLLNAYTGNNLFIDNLKVTGSNADGWQYSPEYYWPAKPVNFYAVSPTVSGLTAPPTGNDTFKASYTNKGDVDLLYSVAADQHPGNTQTPQPVSLNFRHALSRVVVNMLSSNPQISVKVYDVSFENVCESGVFEFPRETTAADSKESGTWSEQGGMTTSTVYSNADGSAYLTSAPVLFSNCDYNFALPQTLRDVDATATTVTGSYIKVKCVIDDATDTHNRLWPNSTTPAANVDGEYGVIRFPLVTEKADSWKQGQGYIYNLDINKVPGLNLIEFTVTVDIINIYTGADISSPL